MRVVFDAGSLPASLAPRCRPNTGAASASITLVAATAAMAGRRCTAWTQRSQNPGWVLGERPAPRPRISPTRRPVTPSSAGRRVNEAARTLTTPSAAATATPLRTLTPRANMPSIAITTVVPAKSTARPAVFIAASTAACTSPPLAR